MKEYIEQIPDRTIAMVGVGLATVAIVVLIISMITTAPSTDEVVPEPSVFKGAQGIQGVIGPVGPQGSIGNPGPIGPQGIKGDTTGVPGPEGAVGSQGPIGVQGPQGPIGNRGPVGVPGFLYPTPLSLSAPTFNYPIVVNNTGEFVMLSVPSGGIELGAGTIRPKVDLTNRQGFRLQFTHHKSSEVIKVGLQYLTSDLTWEWLIPAFGEAVQAYEPQNTPFIAIPQFVDRDFTTRIIVFGDDNTDVVFSYLGIDAR